MPFDRRLELTRAAEEDVLQALQFTGETWGAEQQDAFALLLHEGLQSIVDFPNIGVRRDDLRKGVRSRVVGVHVVFYRVFPDRVVIQRLIHHRRALGPEAIG